MDGLHHSTIHTKLLLIQIIDPFLGFVLLWGPMSIMSSYWFLQEVLDTTALPLDTADTAA